MLQVLGLELVLEPELLVQVLEPEQVEPNQILSQLWVEGQSLS